MTKYRIIISSIFLAIATTAPVIPTGEMTMLYAYQELAGIEHDDAFVSSSTEEKAEQCPAFSDQDANGIVSVAVFQDEGGKIYCVKIEDSVYEKMGKLNGISFNPTKIRYETISQFLIPDASAAVTIDTTSSASQGSDGSYSSLTWAHTVAADATMLVVGVATYGNCQPSGITYNSAALTKDVAYLQGSYTAADLWHKNSPSTGSNNVVVTYGTNCSQAGAGAVSFKGATVTSGTQSAGGLTPSSSSLSVTSSANSIVIDVLAHQYKISTITVGTGQTSRWEFDNGSTNRPNGASTEPGASSVTMTWTSTMPAGENWAHVAMSIDETTPYTTKGYVELYSPNFEHGVTIGTP